MRSHEESDLQRALVLHLNLRAHKDVYWFHPPNGGFRNAKEGAIFKGLGVKPGVPDLIFLKAGKFFGLELKAPGGKCSDNQLACHFDLVRAGGAVAVADTIDAALEILEGWGVLRENHNRDSQGGRAHPRADRGGR